MLSSQYYLDRDDSGITTMAAASSTATAIALGNTEVLLKDKRILVYRVLLSVFHKYHRSLFAKYTFVTVSRYKSNKLTNNDKLSQIW